MPAIRVPLRNRAGEVVAQVRVSLGDWAQAREYPWYLGSDGYAVRSSIARRPVRLHRSLLGLVPHDGLEADHINGVRLDCRRSNLRVCTKAQNRQNRSCRRDSKSRFRGVAWDAARNKWSARVTTNGVVHYLGRFQSELVAGAAAAAARDELFTHNNEERPR